MCCICKREPEVKLNDLDYADDIALLENNQDQAQKQLDETNKNAIEVGLEINITKTVQMIINPPTTEQFKALTLNGEYIQLVSDFKYLGSTVAFSEKDIQNFTFNYRNFRKFYF